MKGGNLRLLLIVLVAGVVIGLVAWGATTCGSTARAPEAALLATPPASTPPSATVSADFRAFAKQVQAAVDAHDLSFFANHSQTQHVVCKEGVRELGDPQCDYVGQEYEGLELVHWHSEGSLVPQDQALRYIELL